MSQNPLAYSSSQSSQPSKPSPLKPQLASALASLEVQLEQELTRYRRSRPTGVRAPLFGSNPSQFPINNPVVPPNYPTDEPTTNQTQISDSSPSDSSLSEPNSFTVAARISNTAPSEIETSSKLPPTEIPGMSLPTPPPPPGMAIKSNLENLENLETEKSENHQLSANQNPSQETSQDIFLSEDNFDLDENLSENTASENISTGNISETPTARTNRTQGSIITSATATSSSPQPTTRNANFGIPPTGEPDDYLESSEALLRSLAEEDTSADRRDHRNNNSLLSPLGIGSMLLLLIASAVLGIVLFQPKLIPQGIFGSSSQRNANSDTTNSDTTKTNTGTNSQKVAEPQLTPVPQYPNLANDEFPEVKSPNDVVGLTPKPTVNPQSPANTPPNPSAITPVPGSNVGVPTSELPPANQLPVNPAPPAAVQPNIQTNIQAQPNQTQPNIQPNQPTNPPAQKPAPISDADLKPSASGMYQFVVPNQGDTAFANTRKIVPDAYVSPDKKYIHVGAVSSKERAKKLLAELQSKGLNPQPYQP